MRDLVDDLQPSSQIAGFVAAWLIVVWSNDGAASFTSDVKLATGQPSIESALADLDDDGDLDAFVANFNGQGNRVYLNDGAGQFTATTQSLGSFDSHDVSLGDVDGDGDLDAFVANEFGQGNKVWLNDGSGLFSDSGQSLGTGRTTAVELGDLDGDGDLDAFVTNFTQPNIVWLNDGLGNFSSSSQQIGNGNGHDVSLGDFDGDGDLDAIVVSVGTDSTVFINNGSGFFTAGYSALLGNSHGIDVGDLDHDGFLSNTSHTFRILDNDSDANGDPLTITHIDGQTIVASGTVTLSGTGAQVTLNANGTITYDPTGSATLIALTGGQQLDDSFSYEISDGIGGSDTANVTITVTGINHAPTATANTAAVSEDNVALTSIDTGNVLTDDDGAGVDADIDGDSLTVSRISTDGGTTFVDLTASTPLTSGSEFLVNTSVTTANQQFPTTTGLTNGNFVITRWDDSAGAQSSGDDGSLEAVRGQLYAANGAPIGNEFLVNSATTGGQAYPSVASLTNGGFVVAWHDNSQGVETLGDDSSGFAIRGQLYDAVGATVGSEFLINDTTTGNQTQASASGLDNGGFVVIWTDRSLGAETGGDDTSDNAIRGQVFNANGTLLGGEFLVHPNITASSQGDPSVTGLTNGGFVVTWTDDSQTGGDISSNAVRGQLFDGSGTRIGNEFLVNSATSSSQGTPDVTSLTGGGFVVTWQDFSQGSQTSNDDTSLHAVRGQIYSSTGVAVGSEFLINTTTTNDQSDASVTSLADGGFVVVWSDQSLGVETSGDDSSGGAIRGQRFDATGSPVGAEFLVNSTTTSDQGAPDVATLANGNIVVTWHDNSQGVETGGDDSSALAIRAQIFDIQSTTQVVGQFGTLTIFADGSYSYEIDNSATNIQALADGQLAQDVFTYEVADGNGGTDTATVSFAVAGANDAPEVSGPTAFTTDEDVTLVISEAQLRANATDVDGDTLSIQNLTATNGTLIDNGNSTWTFTPTNHFSGTADLSYDVFDGTVAVAATGSVTITPVADAPYPMVTGLLPSGGEFNIAASTVGQPTLSSQDIAVLSNNTYVMVWGERSGSDITGVQGQIFNNDGTSAGSVFQINTGSTTGTVTDPEVHPLSAGGFLTVWYQENPGNGQDLVGQRFTDNGTLDGGQFTIDTANDPRFFAETAITNLNDGGFVIALAHAQNAVTDDYDIQLVRYDAIGQFVSNTQVVGSVGREYRPDLTTLADGSFGLTWTSTGQAGDPDPSDGIRAIFYDATGAALTSQVQVNNFTSGAQYRSQIVAVDGGYMIVWVDVVQDGSGSGIYGQKFAADGSYIGNEITLSAVSAPDQYELEAVALDDGGFAVFFQSQPGQRGDESWGVFGSRFTSDGVAIGDEFHVNANTDGVQAGPVIDQLSNGELLITWLDWNADFTANQINGQNLTLGPDTPSGVDSILGTEDIPTDLPIVIDLVDRDGSQSITDITLTGLPAGLTLSAGTVNAGAWTLTVAELAGLQVLAPQDYNGSFILNVSATSIESVGGDTATSSLNIPVTITPVNDAPEITSNGGGNTAFVSIDENTAAVTTVTSSDVDGGAPVYSIITGNDGALFGIDAAGNLTFNSAPDFEIPLDQGGNNVYQVEVGVTDGNLGSDSQLISVTVDDVSEAPPKVGFFTNYNNSLVIDGYTQSIERAGGEAVRITTFNEATLSELDALVFDGLNSSSTFSSNRDLILEHVSNGMGLNIDDWHNQYNVYIPDASIQSASFLSSEVNIDENSIFAEGAGGILTDTSLDDGGSSIHGAMAASSLPVGAIPHLTSADNNSVTGFSMDYGQGTIVYSTMPLSHYHRFYDFFYDSSGDRNGDGVISQVSNGMNNYLTNVVEELIGLGSPVGSDLDIQGDDRRNNLTGGDGDDKISGNANTDILTGGNGADIFVFKQGEGSASLSGADTITDFVIGTDRIEVQGLSFGDLIFDVNGADATIFDGVNSQYIAIVTGQANNLTASDFIFTADPLVVDLNGDGIDLSASVAFDLNDDGDAEQIAWAGPQEGIIVVDLDGSGAIEDGSEVFSPWFDEGGYEDALVALATYDSNADGVIDEQDADFGDLLIWVDGDSDGVSDEGELGSLNDHDIASINLDAVATDSEIDGQHIIYEGEVLLTSGDTIDYVAVEFDLLSSETTGDTELPALGGEQDLLAGLGSLPTIISATDGADTFTLEAGAELFEIIGFDRSQDSLDLGELLDQAFDSASDNINDYVTANTSNGDTTISVDQDGTGGNGAVDIAVLTDIGGGIDLDLIIGPDSETVVTG